MDGYVTIGTELDTKEFDAQIDYVKSQLEEIEYKLKQADMGFEVGDVQKLEADYEKLIDKLTTLIKKKEKFNQIEPTNNWPQIKESIDSVDKGLKKIVKKARQWALAIFGIRGTYMLIRTAINTITEGDEQLKADIQYMKSALAYALEPIVRTIVDLMKRLMVYVGYIVKAWFGIDIFAKANQSLENATSNAQALNKELNKTLASFDEMEVLQDKTSSSSGGGTNAETPIYEFSGKDLQIPGWVKWIAEHGEELIPIIAGITAAILALNLGLSGFKALGIGLIIDGIIKLVKNLKKFVKDPSFENFIHVLQNIAEIALGIALLIGNWPVALVAAVTLIVLYITEHIEEIKEKFKEFRKWLKENFFDKLKERFGLFGEEMAMPFQFLYDFVTGLFVRLFTGIALIINGILLLLQLDFQGGLSKIFEGIKQILHSPVDAFVEAWKNLWPNIKYYVKQVVDGIVNEFKRLENPQNWLPDFTGFLKKLGNIGSYSNPVGWVKKGAEWLANSIFGEKGMLYMPPKLAVGGVINQPGRGVPIGSAMGGERGMEGVIPLTDSQQMELLGEAIGRYITVDFTNITQLDGRQIARKVERINQNNKFVLNR